MMGSISMRVNSNTKRMISWFLLLQKFTWWVPHTFQATHLNVRPSVPSHSSTQITASWPAKERTKGEKKRESFANVALQPKKERPRGALLSCCIDMRPVSVTPKSLQIPQSISLSASYDDSLLCCCFISPLEAKSSRPDKRAYEVLRGRLSHQGRIRKRSGSPGRTSRCFDSSPHLDKCRRRRGTRRHRRT